jgi:hypothetical protein
MSLSKTKNKKSIPIALDSDDNKLVYYNSNQTGSKKMVSKNGYTPYHHGDAVLYVSARRGAGKSTFASMYIKSYVEATDGKVFIISRLDDDPSIQLPHRGMRIPIGELSTITMEDLKNSLVVFDDINDSKFTKSDIITLNAFITDIIENSRHFGISAILTSHMITDYRKTRLILNECSALVVFPQYSNRYQIDRALKTYFSLSKEQRDEVFNSESRWVFMNSITPKFILTEHEVYPYRYN